MAHYTIQQLEEIKVIAIRGLHSLESYKKTLIRVVEDLHDAYDLLDKQAEEYNLTRRKEP